jgi:fatty acid synthase, animal type
MPATSYVVTAWEALAVKESKSIAELPVTFDDIMIHQAVPAEEGQKITLGVQLAPGNRFYVSAHFNMPS